ncbi:hypothetical protein ACFLY9_02200 [Patescibacteria group bacterium]
MDPKIDDLKKKIADLEKEIGNVKNGKEKEVRKEPEKFIPLKILFKWSAAERVYVQRDKPWFLKIAVIALLLILFFAFLQDFMVILVICIIVLIAFLLGSIPPRKVEHKISNKGIESIDKLYKWDELKDFWIAEKGGSRILYVTSKLRFPSRLVMLIGIKDEETIVKLLGEKIDYREFEEKQGWITKATDGEMVNPVKYSHLFKGKMKKKVTQKKAKK